MKTDCIQNEFTLQAVGDRDVVVKRDGGTISSDGGLVLLSLIEKRYGIVAGFSKAFRDLRNPKLIRHNLRTLIAQRLFGLCQGYEDLNDHDAWRRDPLLAIACGTSPCETGVAGRCMLNRLELGGRPESAKERYKNIRYDADAVKRTLIELFLDHYPGRRKRGPREIVIDVDSTDDPLHGNQEGRFFNGFYDEYCYLPLYFFVGQFPLWAELITSDVDSADAVVPALKAMVSMIRKRWPKTRIVLRGDSGFCRPKIFDWCEQPENKVLYVIGLPKNPRLKRSIGGSLREAARLHRDSGQPERIFRDLRYKTRKTWKRARRVVANAEHLADGSNPRFIVSNIGKDEIDARSLYEDLYCARGRMENRIKEQKLCLFADRLSTTTLRANQLRLWFSTFAYLFMVLLRIQDIGDAELPKMQASTLRLKFLKVAARVTVSVRRTVVHIPESFPYWLTWFALQAVLLV
ncbi:MAG: IS1380 family transposase [Spirochaetota bacterium]